MLLLSLRLLMLSFFFCVFSCFCFCCWSVLIVGFAILNIRQYVTNWFFLLYIFLSPLIVFGDANTFYNFFFSISATLFFFSSLRFFALFFCWIYPSSRLFIIFIHVPPLILYSIKTPNLFCFLRNILKNDIDTRFVAQEFSFIFRERDKRKKFLFLL